MDLTRRSHEEDQRNSLTKIGTASCLTITRFLSFGWFLREFFEWPAIKQLEVSKRLRRNYEEKETKPLLSDNEKNNECHANDND